MYNAAKDAATMLITSNITNIAIRLAGIFKKLVLLFIILYPLCFIPVFILLYIISQRDNLVTPPEMPY